MPLTPFHFGPAAFLKALTPRCFSFLTFCYSQVVIDLEVAYHIVARQERLHGIAHTYLGALILGLFCGVTALPLHALAVRLSPMFAFRTLVLNPLTLKTALLSAVLGTVSHVVLDSIMHHDMTPFAPFAESNGLLNVLSLQSLHLFCMTTGIVGLVWCGRLAKRSDNDRLDGSAVR